MWRQVRQHGIHLSCSHGIKSIQQNQFMNGYLSYMKINRCFSSNIEKTPSIIEKAFNDKDRFNEWNRNGIFSPDMFTIKKMALFTMLHQIFPSKDAFDIPEFLHGAKNALEIVLNIVYSDSFLNASIDSKKEIELLNDIMTIECLNILKEGFKIHYENGCTKFELKKLDIHGVYFENIEIAQNQSSILFHVKFHTAEHVVVHGIKDGNTISESSIREAETKWIFESPLPNIQWTIISM